MRAGWMLIRRERLRNGGVSLSDMSSNVSRGKHSHLKAGVKEPGNVGKPMATVTTAAYIVSYPLNANSRTKICLLISIKGRVFSSLEFRRVCL